MARREKRWERLLAALEQEFQRLEDALDDAADLAGEQEREIVRLQERIDALEDELAARGDPDDC